MTRAEFDKRTRKLRDIPVPGDPVQTWNARYLDAMTSSGLKMVHTLPELADYAFWTMPLPCPGSDNPWPMPSYAVCEEYEEPARPMRRNIRAVQFTDLEFQNGKLVKVHPFDRYQYMSGDELIALVGRLGEMLYEARNPPSDRPEQVPEW